MHEDFSQWPLRPMFYLHAIALTDALYFVYTDSFGSLYRL